MGYDKSSNKRKIKWKKVSLAITIFLILTGNALADDTLWHTSPDRWSEPRTFHSAFDEGFDKGIVISRGKIHPAPNIKKVFSSNKAYGYAIQGADYTKPGPYSLQQKKKFPDRPTTARSLPIRA